MEYTVYIIYLCVTNKTKKMNPTEITIPISDGGKILVSRWNDEQIIQIETCNGYQHFKTFINTPLAYLPELIEALTKLKDNG